MSSSENGGSELRGTISLRVAFHDLFTAARFDYFPFCRVFFFPRPPWTFSVSREGMAQGEINEAANQRGLPFVPPAPRALHPLPPCSILFFPLALSQAALFERLCETPRNRPSFISFLLCFQTHPESNLFSSCSTTRKAS